MNRLRGKVALVTGGNSGIGESIAKIFAQEGALVIITGRRQGELDRVVSDIVKTQGTVCAVAGSVTDEFHVQGTVRRAVAQFGRLDILVNNAGVGDFGKRLHEIDDVTWAQVLDVNLTGVFRVTRAVLPQMLRQGKGVIINISSVASLIGMPTLPAYAASKGALDAMTRALAFDYAKEGIRCNAVNPGLIATPMAAPLMSNPDRLDPILSQYPIARVGKPEEVAHLVLYLASDEAAWVTGGIFPIDGGLTSS